LAPQLADQVVFYEVNTDESPDLAAKFGIMSIPTMVLLKNGQEVERVIGALPEDRIREFATK
jgi:thioredoxin 1